jgi:hypothetical protein
MARPLRYIVCAIAALAIVAATSGPASASRSGGATASTGQSSSTAFDGNGMWIWYVARSGGSASAIIHRARAHHVSTVFVKSGDGTGFWSVDPIYGHVQFTRGFVSALKAGGLHVCGWQYVYGARPGDEATVAAQAKKNGAECFVIDAEAQYEGGKYSQARKYMHKLRNKVGKSYPIGLAGFPYVDYHPSFPYSVFLGPGGAQFNVPQVYWKAIGVSVDTAMGHTYLWNRPYGRPIYPLGQLYQDPSRKEIIRFRKYALAEHARGVSWWDWQEATNTGWLAIGDPLSAFHHSVVKNYATLSQGGGFFDLVLWAQEHLRGAGQSAPSSGVFDAATTRAVKGFQRSNGLTVSGRIDKRTWIALLRYPVARASAARLSAASSSHSMPRAKRYEIPPPALRH